MLRFLGVVFIGMGIGVALVATVVSMGSDPGTERGVAAAISVNEAPLDVVAPEPDTIIETLARVESLDVPVYAPAFYFWQDGYSADPLAKRWAPEHLASLTAYLSDWQLPPEVPDKHGRLSLAVEAHISRQHPERLARLMRTVDHSCQVWIERPLAQEEVTWDGSCNNGLAEGDGVLTRSYVLKGELYEIGYHGPMKDGKAHGVGKTVDANFIMYKGQHERGLYHGKGSLTDLGYDGISTYVGAFKDGYPHGFGRKQKDNRVLEGTWEDGCYADDEHFDRVLRHAIECHGLEAPDFTNASDD